jgi:uncharacterized membrane protein YphA (DoxX/SURF4 family)
MIRIGLRVSIGVIFIAMGSWKFGQSSFQMGGRIGELFTFLSTLQPWWGMVGATQIGAGLLLMTPRFTTLAAAILFGVTVNIAAINIALWPDFGYTMTLTAYAFVGLVLLLLHDINRWRFLFWQPSPQSAE